MGHVEDLWTTRNERGRKVPSARAKSGKRWRASWTEPGGQRRSRSFTVKDAAVEFLLEREREIAGGTYLSGGDTPFGEYGRRWIAGQLHQRDGTRRSLEAHWRARIEPAFGAMRLRDIRRDHIQDAVVSWTALVQPTTLSVSYAYLRAILTSAVDDQMITRNPARKISRPPVTRSRPVPPTTVQVLLMAERAEAWVRPMLLFAAATGLRPGELRGLTTDRITFTDSGAQVDVDRQLLDSTPTWGPLKTPGSERTIGIDRDTAVMLRRHILTYPSVHGLVFTGMRRLPWDRRGLSAAWRRISAGILPQVKGRAWHQMRHYHASMLIRAGQSPRAVADRLGHTDPAETLRTYSHLWVDDEQRAVAAVGAELWPKPGLSLVPNRVGQHT